jgi:hypothetical protein
MAYWTEGGGWQSYSLPTDAKTDYRGEDFLSSYPSVTTNDFSAKRDLWVLVKSGVAIGSSDTEKSGAQSGGTWRKFTLTDKGGGAGDQLPGVTLNPQFIKDVNGVIKGLQEQVVSAVDTENNNRNQQRADIASSLNAQGQAANDKGNAVNNWSSSLKTKLANAKDGSYVPTLSAIDSNTLRSYLTADEYQTYVKAAADSFDSGIPLNKGRNHQQAVLIRCTTEPKRQVAPKQIQNGTLH